MENDITNCDIIGPVVDMAKEMSKADVLITSGGRTVFEASCCGVPCIVVSQNKREFERKHLHIDNGIYNAGLISEITPTLIKRGLTYFKNFDNRHAAKQDIQKMVDGLGIYRVLGIIDKEWRNLNC